MRYLIILLLAISAGQAITPSAWAQPVMLEAQPLLNAPKETGAPPTPAPDAQTKTPVMPSTKPPASATPNLTPDTIKPHSYGFTPPSGTPEGQSTVSPRHEPWEKKDNRAERAELAQKVFHKLPADIQDRILAETYEAHHKCTIYETYAQFHDCDCVGSVFFDERVLDPESSKDVILSNVARHCVFVPGVAAYGYSQCHAGMRFVLVPQRADDYCKCYAEEFGKNYQRSPYPDFDNIRAIGKLANNHCIRAVPYAFKNQLRR